MGTSNFHYENVLYTVDDTDDEFVCEDTIGNIKCELNQYHDFMEDSNIRLDSELRSYPSSSIGSFDTYVSILDDEVKVEVIPLVRSAYYEGCNFDYEVNINWNCVDYASAENVIDDMIEYSDMNRGLLKIHRETYIQRIEDKVKEYTDIIEKVFEMHTDKTEVVAQFSNGETLYNVA